MDRTSQRAGWKSGTMTHGAPSVTIPGISMMLRFASDIEHVFRPLDFGANM